MIEEKKEIKIYENTNPKQVKIYDHEPLIPPEDILSVNLGFNQFETYEILSKMVALQEEYQITENKLEHVTEDQTRCSCKGRKNVKKEL